MEYSSIKSLGITGKLGVWLYHFLTHRSHLLILQGAISHDSPVLSGRDLDIFSKCFYFN